MENIARALQAGRRVMCLELRMRSGAAPGFTPIGLLADQSEGALQPGWLGKQQLSAF